MTPGQSLPVALLLRQTAACIRLLLLLLLLELVLLVVQGRVQLQLLTVACAD
jgi:hypothetical protein